MSKNNHGKRMVPEYLIAKLETLEPGGGEYTAGTGIDIEDNTISIDDTIVATQEDLEDYELKADAFSGSYNDLTDKPTIPTKTSDLQNDSNFIQNATQQRSIILQTEFGNFNIQSNFVTMDATEEVSGDSSSITIAGEQIDIDTPALYYNTVKVATINDIPTTATSNSTVTPSTIQLTFTYSDNTTETITVMTGASVTTTTTLS